MTEKIILRTKSTNENYTVPVTLVIPHRNRTDDIRRCLRSLQESTTIPREVFIVDDESDEEQQRLLSDIISEFKSFSIKLFCFNEHVGTSDAKNLGLFYSRTPYTWFLDSDTEIIKLDALELGCQLLDKYPDIGVVGAEIVEDRKHRRYIRETYLLKSLWSAFIHHPRENEIRKEVDITPTCNFLTRTDLMKEIGGFHSKLVNGEDKLACLQIRELKYKIFLDSRFGVLHHQSPTERAQFLKRIRITFRDVAFIYGATNNIWKLIVFHLMCGLSLRELYKNNMEMYRDIGHHQDNSDIVQTSGIYGRLNHLGKLGKIIIQYVLANKTYMSVKGYCFRLSNKTNLHQFQDRVNRLPMMLKE